MACGCICIECRCKKFYAYQSDFSNRESLYAFIEKVNSIAVHISLHPLAYRSAGKEDVREAIQPSFISYIWTNYLLIIFLGH